MWVLAWTANRAGHPIGTFDVPIYWPAAALSAMHFGLSYHLAYADGGAALRRRPVTLLIAPAILAAILIGVVVVSLMSGAQTTRGVTRLLLGSVFVLATWHYVKQVYGVVRLGAGFRNLSLGVGEIRILRYGLYPLWLIGAGQVLANGTSARSAGFDVTLHVLPAGLFAAARIVAVGCAALIAFVLTRVGLRHHVVPPALMVAPYVAAFLWLVVPVSYLGATLALGALHALQYIACCHRAETARPSSRLAQQGVLGWLEIFAGAACGGLILTSWAPQWLNRVVPVEEAPLLFTAVFFVFLNLHHYLIDAVIWRSKGDIVRSMVAAPNRSRVSQSVGVSVGGWSAESA